MTTTIAELEARYEAGMGLCAVDGYIEELIAALRQRDEELAQAKSLAAFECERVNKLGAQYELQSKELERLRFRDSVFSDEAGSVGGGKTVAERLQDELTTAQKHESVKVAALLSVARQMERLSNDGTLPRAMIRADTVFRLAQDIRAALTARASEPRSEKGE